MQASREADGEKARRRRAAAVEAAEAVLREYGGTEQAAKAEKNLAELEMGRRVYIGGAGTAAGG